MITLEKEFVSGEGGFSTDPLTYKQLKRTEGFAVYERSRDGKVKDYEVIVVRVDPKGKVQKFPNGIVKVLEDDIEHYPSTGQWGKLAWSFRKLGGAMARFDALIAQGIEDDAEEENPTPEKVIVIHNGEWTIGELGEKNGIEYVTAHVFVKAALAAGSVKFVREERRNVKGKASRIYIKA